MNTSGKNNSQYRHGGAIRGKQTKEYSAWCDMKKRCYSIKCKAYPRYGGRGIKVCDEWVNSFSTFLSDMGKAPSKAHSLERNNNDGNYEKSNCSWEVREVQDNNKRDCLYIIYNGERKTLSQWARAKGYNRCVIEKRFHEGWTANGILNTPVGPQRKNRLDNNICFNPPLFPLITNCSKYKVA